MTEKPSVVFLIPFASRQVRTNWSTACKYLEQTIRSIRNSANQNYRVIVAGNEEPELEKGFDGKVHFLSVCGCAWELFGGQDSSRKSSGRNSCLVDSKIKILAMLRQ